MNAQYDDEEIKAQYCRLNAFEDEIVGAIARVYQLTVRDIPLFRPRSRLT